MSSATPRLVRIRDTKHLKYRRNCSPSRVSGGYRCDGARGFGESFRGGGSAKWKPRSGLSRARSPSSRRCIDDGIGITTIGVGTATVIIGGTGISGRGSTSTSARAVTIATTGGIATGSGQEGWPSGRPSASGADKRFSGPFAQFNGIWCVETPPTMLSQVMSDVSR